MKTRQTLEELMHSLNVEKWPERWGELYDKVMDDYEEKAERRMHRGATPLPHVILPDNGIIL